MARVDLARPFLMIDHNYVRFSDNKCCHLCENETTSHTFAPSFKGTHTIYFSSSFYIINQKPMIPRTHFHYKPTWVARFSGYNSAMHLLILWFRFTSQMALLSNINFYFDCKTRLCLIVPGRQEKIYFCTRKFLSTRYTR